MFNEFDFKFCSLLLEGTTEKIIIKFSIAIVIIIFIAIFFRKKSSNKNTIKIKGNNNMFAKRDINIKGRDNYDQNN